MSAPPSQKLLAPLEIDEPLESARRAPPHSLSGPVEVRLLADALEDPVPRLREGALEDLEVPEEHPRFARSGCQLASPRPVRFAVDAGVDSLQEPAQFLGPPNGNQLNSVVVVA